ncbi:MAG: tRNA (adenosine(37)-N6)-threonylcarbamoyltransferase complex transferase subunit TsaD [Minisyncoccales bacterium]
MKILAIETSCDDTGVAILENKKEKFKILANTLASQTKIHKQWGGVVPMLAKREHQKTLIPLLEKAINKSGLTFFNRQNFNKKKKEIKAILKREENLYRDFKKFIKTKQIPDFDAIAVTKGPGLDPCLWVGINFAKALSLYLEKPIIPINHIEAHIFSGLITKENFKHFALPRKIEFPALSLIVSGGHTQLILIKKLNDYTMLGETRDDAAGECFDKIAKLLEMEYPGGPKISQKAKEWNGNSSFSFPRPMLNHDNLDFSFSGLKTAVLYHLKKIPELTENKKREIAYEAQEAITDVLTIKTIKAVKKYNVKTLIVGGGVSANQRLRKKIKEKIEKEKNPPTLILPLKNITTDNALMVGITALYKYNKEKTLNIKNLKSDPNLRIE